MESRKKRGMSGLSVAFLWAGVAVSVSEIWAGSLLRGSGLFYGILIILVGHLLGGLVLSAGGKIGSRYKIMSMQSTRLILGNRGSVIPSLLNVLQLVGWASIMLALSGSIGANVGKALGAPFNSKVFWIVLIGAGTLAWSFLVGSTKLQWIHTLVILGLIALSVLMTCLALNPNYYQVKAAAAPDFGFASGMRMMDLVIVMPISWVPLIADYSRLARDEGKAFWGSFIGYGLVSSWMYLIGLLVSLATGSADPAANILRMMGSVGIAVPAVALVFLSTMTSDFPDIYSSACSLFNIHPKIKPAYTMWGTGILTIIIALFFDLSRFEDFLSAVGAFFVPLFAILLCDYYIVRRQQLDGIDFESGKGLEFTRGYHIRGLVIWGCGVLVFFAAQYSSFPMGGSITSFLVSALLFLLFSGRKHS